MIDSQKEATLIEKILEGKPEGLYLTSEHIKKAIEYCSKNSNVNINEKDFEKSVYDILGIIYPYK